MDYLKSFIIGSSGLNTVQHFSWFYLNKEKNKDFPFKLYSIIAPIYFGIMNMLALYIGKTHKLSLQNRLFITSIISVIFIFLLNFIITSKKVEYYKNWTSKDWIYYIIRNGARHIIIFNLIMYTFEKYFSQSDIVKAFIIGGSIFSYLGNYLKVIQLDNQSKITYDYRLFTVVEPFIASINYIIAAIIIPKLLNISIRKSILFYSVLIPVLWYYYVNNYDAKKYYKFTKKELQENFMMFLVYSMIRYNYVLHYLFTNLK